MRRKWEYWSFLGTWGSSSQWHKCPSSTQNYPSYVFNAVRLFSLFLVKKGYWPHWSDDSECLLGALQWSLPVTCSLPKLFFSVVYSYLDFFLEKGIYSLCYLPLLPETTVRRRCTNETGNLDSSPQAALLETSSCFPQKCYNYELNYSRAENPSCLHVKLCHCATRNQSWSV